MSTVFSPTPASVGVPGEPTRRRAWPGSRGLTTGLLAAAVALLILVADRVIGEWADEHLLLGWLAMWAVVFAGTAALGGTARRLALSGLRGAASWGRALAEARRELQTWNRIRNDAGQMAAWAASRQTAGSDAADAGSDVQALPAQGWGRFPEHLADERDAHAHLKSY
jgi:hypothetical protein